MKIRMVRDIVKEIDGVRQPLTAGQVVEIRDPDAASLISHGYAERFQDAAAASAEAAAPVADVVDESDPKNKRAR